MAKLKFTDGIVEDYTLVLSTRDYCHLGQLTGVQNVHYSANLNSANELSFSVVKHADCAIWEQIVDFKLVWVKELNEYFEIKVSTADSLETSKTITGTALCEAELSQIYFSAEINTESDIARDDYEITTFYNETQPKASLLHRVLEKVPYYKIKYVDDSLKNIQRTFSVSDSTIYDFLVGECAEQFDCLFVFDSSDRSISVYDLEHFGKDTTIFVDKDNLTDNIQLETNADNVKNCFKLVAGDDYMTAAIRMLNPNGSDYIYYISEAQRKDMPQELAERLDSYDALVHSHMDEYQKLISCEDKDNPGIYQLTDKIIYLESGMMPSIEHAEVTASTEAEKLNSMNLSPLGLSDVTTSTSLATVSSALKNYARVYAKTGYVKLEIDSDASFVVDVDEDGEVVKDESGWKYGTWHGRFIVTNYSDATDVAYSDYMNIIVSANYQEWVEQKMLKAMSQSDDDSSVFDVLPIENLEDFQTALTFYGKNRLESFFDAIQGALGVLIQLDQASEAADLYGTLYEPYYAKLQACQTELDLRQSEIDELQAQLDSKETERLKIQKALDFQTHLGEYYDLFLSYRREDTYSNGNYISDGLSNAEMIEKAKEFMEVAEKELYLSGEQQLSISSTLYNLLVMDAFKPILNDFELGNWIRVKADGIIYRLRLLGYSINFANLQTLEVQFSNVTKVKDVSYEANQILETAKSMATTYSYVTKQAAKGQDASNTILSALQNGLNSGLVQIKNNDKEEVTYGKHGILCRNYDDIAESYDDKQLRLTHNTIAFTDNNWKSVKTVIGEHNYETYNADKNAWEALTDYGMTAQFVTAGIITGENKIIGGEIYSKNYSDGNTLDENGNALPKGGSMINLNTGDFSFGGESLYYKDGEFVISDTVIGDSLQSIDIKAENLHIAAANIDGTLTAEQIESGTIKAGSVDAENISGKRLSGKEFTTLLRNQLDEDVVGLYIGEDGFDFCWDASIPDFAENVYGHVRITGQSFSVIVGSQTMMSFSASARINGGNVGTHAYIPRILYDELLQMEKG